MALVHPSTTQQTKTLRLVQNTRGGHYELWYRKRHLNPSNPLGISEAIALARYEGATRVRVYTADGGHVCVQLHQQPETVYSAYYPPRAMANQ